MNLRVWIGIAKLVGAVALIAIVVYLLRQSPAGQRLSSVNDARAFVASLAPLDKPAFVLCYAVGALFLPGTLLSFVARCFTASGGERCSSGAARCSDASLRTQ